jgi:hypothetical protein
MSISHFDPEPTSVQPERSIPMPLTSVIWALENFAELTRDKSDYQETQR